MSSEQITMNADLQRISEEGKKIYEKIKNEYEPKFDGKYMAIDIDTEDVYIGDDSTEVLFKAKAEHPKNVFYLVKIGYKAVETLTRFFKS